jgi:predicted kinase
MTSRPRLIVVSGLPGSGKSHYLDALLAAGEADYICHDFHARAVGDSKLVRDSVHLSELLEALRTGKTCAVADVAFCREQRRDAFIEVVKGAIPDVLIELRCFRNDPTACLANAKRRNRDSLERERNLIEKYSRAYEIPSSAAVLEVYTEK